MPRERAWLIMALVGREKGSVLYWELKVAVPQIRGGRRAERGGWVGGIFDSMGVVFESKMVGIWGYGFASRKRYR